MAGPAAPQPAGRCDGGDAEPARTNASSHITTLFCGDVCCHIVGVCHLSVDSIHDAFHAIQKLRPALVCVELCEERQHLLDSGDEPPEVLPPLSLATFRENWRALLNPIFWVVHLQLMGMEALLGTRLGMEQVAAVAAAGHVGASALLVDRPLSITLCRTLAAAADLAAVRELLAYLFSPSPSPGSSPGGVVRDVAELERMLLSSDLSSSEFVRASSLARRVIDRLLNSPHPWDIGRAGRPIQEERDYLLSHSLYHACCTVPSGGRVVGVLGAAHVPGVVRHFGTFKEQGCTADRCGVEEHVRSLYDVSLAPIYALAGGLLLTSGAGIVGRFALLRHLRRTRPTWARRFSVGSCAVAAGLGGFGLYRAQRQYSAVRALQLHRLAEPQA